MEQQNYVPEQTPINQSTAWYKRWWVIVIGLIITLPLIWITLPIVLIWIIWSKTKWHKSVKIISTIIIPLFFIISLIIITAGEVEKDKKTTSQITQKETPKTEQVKEVPVENVETETTPTETTPDKDVETTVEISDSKVNPEPSSEEPKMPSYEVIYELPDKRYDGGISYYVLIEKVNLKDDAFKNDIKSMINQIVKEKGKKISIDFVDERSILDLEYKSHYGSNTLGRILTKSEMAQLGLHLIATYSGNLETDIYLNSLSFFPATFKDNATVGKYVETIEFNPTVN